MIWYYFPLLFVLHELEEIFTLRRWFLRNGPLLCRRFPRLGPRLLAHAERLSTGAFSAIAVEELMIIVLISLAAASFGAVYIYTGVIIAFTVHLAVHIVQTIVWRGYVPATITSILILPTSLYLLHSLNVAYDFALPRLFVASAVAVVLMVVNLFAAHRIALRTTKTG